MRSHDFYRVVDRHPHGPPIKREVTMSYRDLQEKYGFVPMDHQEPRFFPVRENGVYDDKGRKVPGYKRIERGDSGDTIAIHTDKYVLIPYEQRFSVFEQAIARAGLPVPVIGTDMDHNGAKIFRQYLFPDLTHEVGGHDLALRIAMWDSYDGSSRFMGKSGYFSFACANTAYVGKTLADVSFKHTGDPQVQLESAVTTLVEAAAEFPRTVSRLKAWTGVRLIAEQVEKLTRAMPQGNKTLTDHLVAKFAKQPDQNLWGLHQVLTSWATHGDGEKIPPARTVSDRSKRIETLIEGRDWKVLEPA